MLPATRSDASLARVFGVSTIVILIAILVARIAGPSDLWDQTQPRTAAYTVDMLTRGGDAWILARDAEGQFATKPPLYNWLAAPAVALFGRGSEIAHKLPSMLAMCAIVALLVRWGEAWRRSLGWLAALMWLACYPIFKLGYLARPDMLLCLILLLGWHCATTVIIREDAHANHTWRRVVAFWICVALAAWTKGPVAVVLPTYAIVATFCFHRSLRPLQRLAPIPGIIGSLILGVAWYVLAYFLQPQHVQDTLIYAEVIGRISGNGPEGGHRGFQGILLGVATMPLYFLVRFVPWSVAAILGALALLSRAGDPLPRWRRVDHGRTLLAGCLWTVLLIALFSLSSGKRADYIAPAYAPAALVAAWWMLCDPYSPVRRLFWLPPLAATIVIAICSTLNFQGTVLTRATTDRFAKILTRLETEPSPGPLVIVSPQLPHFAILSGELPPCDNRTETVCGLVAQGKRVRVFVADPWLDPAVDRLIRSGVATELWSIDATEEARVLGYSATVRMIEFNPPAAGVRIDFALPPEAPQSLKRKPAS